MSAKYKTIRKAQNKKGVSFALAISPDGLYSVHQLKENYSGRVRGGLLKTWCYVKKGLDEAQAVDLFNKKTGAAI